VEDLSPLERNVATADHHDALREVALFEDGLARVVIDLVEAVDGWCPGGTSGRDECFLAGDSGPLIGTVDDLDGRIVG